MGNESVIINFIRENLKMLQQNAFPEELYKQKKHEFFHKKKRDRAGGAGGAGGGGRTAYSI